MNTCETCRGRIEEHDPFIAVDLFDELDITEHLTYCGPTCFGVGAVELAVQLTEEATRSEYEPSNDAPPT